MTDLKWIIESFEEGVSLRELERQTGVSRKKIASDLSKVGLKPIKSKALPEEDVVRQYNEGSSQAELARKYNCSDDAVRRILLKHGVTIRTGRVELSSSDVDELYEAGLTLREIAERFDCSSNVVRKALSVSPRSNAESHQKYTCDEDFFATIDDEFKAYWLGFMFADGYIKANLRDFGITLKRSDRPHLEKFAGAIDYNGPIRDYSAVTSYGESEYSRIVIASRKACANLIASGCVPNKTYCAGAPLSLDQDYARHFIRGVVDGDGYIGVYPSYISLEICGRYDVLSWIKEVGPEKMSLPQPHKSIWRIRTTNPEWIRWLYKGSSVSLERKADKCQTILNG